MSRLPMKEKRATTVSVSKSTFHRWNNLAKQLDVNRSQALTILVNAAIVVGAREIAFNISEIDAYNHYQTIDNQADAQRSRAEKALESAYKKLTEYERFFALQEMRIAEMEQTIMDGIMRKERPYAVDR